MLIRCLTFSFLSSHCRLYFAVASISVDSTVISSSLIIFNLVRFRIKIVLFFSSELIKLFWNQRQFFGLDILIVSIMFRHFCFVHTHTHTRTYTPSFARNRFGMRQRRNRNWKSNSLWRFFNRMVFRWPIPQMFVYHLKFKFEECAGDWQSVICIDLRSLDPTPNQRDDQITRLWLLEESHAIRTESIDHSSGYSLVSDRLREKRRNASWFVIVKSQQILHINRQSRKSTLNIKWIWRLTTTMNVQRFRKTH